MYAFYIIYAVIPKKDCNAVEDFLEVIITAYVITAAADVLNTEPRTRLTSKSHDRPVRSVNMLARKICEQSSCLQRLVKNMPDTDNKVLEHTQKLMTLVLLWCYYHDIIREGDGDRFINFMPVLMYTFKGAGNMNYAIDTCLVQLQYHYLMSERMKTQLLFSKYINTHAIKGKNIACDLHMEHINR